MNNCLFCRIVKKEIPSEIVFENDNIMAFNDINPVAPVHILIIPKTHIENIDELDPSHEALVGELIYASQKIAREKGISENGYRLVFNVKKHGGQIINHLHLHLIGGKMLGPMA